MNAHEHAGVSWLRDGCRGAASTVDYRFEYNRATDVLEVQWRSAFLVPYNYDYMSTFEFIGGVLRVWKRYEVATKKCRAQLTWFYALQMYMYVDEERGISRFIGVDAARAVAGPSLACASPHAASPGMLLVADTERIAAAVQHTYALLARFRTDFRFNAPSKSNAERVGWVWKMGAHDICVETSALDKVPGSVFFSPETPISPLTVNGAFLGDTGVRVMIGASLGFFAATQRHWVVVVKTPGHSAYYICDEFPIPLEMRHLADTPRVTRDVPLLTGTQ